MARGGTKISQETFEAAVLENEDLEMSRSEAILAAKEQFALQGADLSGVDTTLERGEDRRLLVAAIASADVETIARLCSCDPKERRAANASFAGNVAGAIDALCRALPGSAEALSAVCREAAEHRARVSTEVVLAHVPDPRVWGLIAAMATRCDANKRAFARGGLAPRLAPHLETCPAAADALAAVCANDDPAAVASSTFDNARAFVEAGAVEKLVELGNLFALRQLTKSDEAASRVARRGGLEMCQRALGGADASLALGLLRNLSARDDAKDRVDVRAVCDAMKRNWNDARLCEHGIATLALVALRKPDLAQRIVDAGGAVVVLDAMRSHPGDSRLQRQACLAVRNVVARRPDLRAAFRSSRSSNDTEALLRAAGTDPINVDVAYAALRDLGVDVHVATFERSADGSLARVDKTNQGKPNFRPVFDESRPPNNDDAAAFLREEEEEEVTAHSFALL